jgi:hypothetical protein
MTQRGKWRKCLAKKLGRRRALPCQVQGNILRTPPRALRIPKSYRPHESFGAVATSSTGAVQLVGSDVIAMPPALACYMTSGMWEVAVPATSIWSIRNTAVPTAGNPSTPTCLTMRGRKPPTPIVSWPWPCASSWRMACPIKPRAGTCGAITGCLFPSPPSKTGWRRGGEKGGAAHGDALSRLEPGRLLGIHRGR